MQMLYRTTVHQTVSKYNCFGEKVVESIWLHWKTQLKTKVWLADWQQHNILESTTKGEVPPLSSFSECLCRLYAFVPARGSGHLHCLWWCKCDCARPSWSQFKSAGIPGDLLGPLYENLPGRWVSVRHVKLVKHIRFCFLVTSIQEILTLFPVRTCPNLYKVFPNLMTHHSQEVYHHSCAPNGVPWRTMRQPSSSTPNRSWRGSNISMTTKSSTETSRWEEQRLGISTYRRFRPWMFKTGIPGVCSHWKFPLCPSGRQRVDQHLQRSLKDLRLWDLQALSRNQPVHRDVRWWDTGSKPIWILLSNRKLNWSLLRFLLY